MLRVKIRVTGYRHAGNYRLRGQKVRGEGERKTVKNEDLDKKRLGLVKDSRMMLTIEISGGV